ncbi:DEAD/DEAH box helicase [Endozoicomonas sp. YOMI1]|uniref:DEAD/DEAH box helicase n=1 Tax=Endozoicomonas sp. YOMI1 TaxID=2828739 RepID=UPI002147F707|nr:ATP-binding domain-containing protein [Endozoicomonas sp. YOMI1]
MASSFFFQQIDKNELNSAFIDAAESYAVENKKQIYLIDKPLGDSKYSYEYNDCLVLLAPGYKITFVHFGDDEDSFEEYVNDFIEDLGSISDKYRYKDIIGRPRAWKKTLIAEETYSSGQSFNEIMDNIILSGGENKKQCELLLSLLTGSINDIEKVKGNIPDNILDKVKQKILLFDGDQTRFVYQKPSSKRITTQGLSGTGKTELLLHKLKELYVEDKTSKLIFTCHNKILADNLRNRIPEFFDFMKVEEQIKWFERLWCVNAWGSQSNKHSGAYSYICDFYNIPFLRYRPSNNFEAVCKQAIEHLKNIDMDQHGFAFDYMLIDESQDFPQSFFELCEKVTAKNIYVAGDIFQSIFDSNIISEIEPDYLLSKCYRTDPKTLMFAHALGMGLFETPKLRWLEDKEWKACGYVVNKSDNEDLYSLSREPLRRFEDLESENYSSIEIVKTSKDLGEDAELKIIDIIREIRQDNPTVLADDIGIIFIDNSKNTYASADRLEISIPREFGWEVNKSYESKEKIPDTLFVSNRNNVKGLEFPFVICVTKKLQPSRSYRNALYMMLTRSFLKSYLLLSQDSNAELIGSIESGLNTIKSNGHLEVVAPSREEQDRIKTTIKYDDDNISFYDFVLGIFDELDVMPIFRKPLYTIVQSIAKDNFDYDKVMEIAEFNYRQMVSSSK